MTGLTEHPGISSSLAGACPRGTSSRRAGFNAGRSGWSARFSLISAASWVATCLCRAAGKLASAPGPGPFPLEV